MQHTFTMLIGLPGSGKSTYAKSLSSDTRAHVVSTDEIRERLSDGTMDPRREEKVFAQAQRLVKEKLQGGENIIFDAANIRRKHRVVILNYLKGIPCTKQAVCILTPYEDCVKRNESKVPENKLKEMYESFNPPHYAEGFDDITFYFNEACFSEKDFSLNKLFYGENGLIHFDQGNSHHSFSLGDHCLAAEKYIRQYAPDDKNLQLAALLHDIGKVQTKTPYNAKGKESEEYHYFNHHNVGAYETLFYLQQMGKGTEDMVDISNLVAFHMHPYLGWKKSKRVFFNDKNLMGEEFINRVYLLHRADVAAH